jgi:indolepyruvate ferredoxin oxidoreductase beta subunit
MDINILIVGVGGQGTLLASKILGNLAQLQGKQCKLSEVHGMSQRGGSVVTHVRIGDNIFSPIISEGEADIILAFEKLEALRWRHYLKKDGTVIVNDQEILPMPVIIGMMQYPSEVFETLEKENKKYMKVDARSAALQAGSERAVNTVMIGAMAKALALPYEKIEQALTSAIKEKFLEINKKALLLGYKMI